MVSPRPAEVWSDAIGANGELVVYGHWGRPLLAFPSEGGNCGQFEERGMVAAIGDPRASWW